MRRELLFVITFMMFRTAVGQTVGGYPNAQPISVPVLVESKRGEIVYGLSSDDFSVRDNGIEQRISLDADSDIRPLSLVIVLQTDHNAAGQLPAVAGLSGLLDGILTNPLDEVSIVTFDSSPHTIQAFTADTEAIANAIAIAAITPGNAGAALFDTVDLAVTSLNKTSPASHRVILLISRDHDHGSVGSNAGSVLRDVAASNTSIYSLSSAAGGKDDFFTKLRSLNPLVITASGMQRNAGETLARLTGGDFYRFDTQRQFEDHIAEIASHIRNRYSLTFRPSNPAPGFHSLQIALSSSKANVVASRTAYWVLPTVPAAGGGTQ
jgi:VWFA-related protein